MFECKYCKVNLSTASHLKTHFKTKKHITNVSNYVEPSNNITKATANTITSANNEKETKFKCIYCNKYLASFFSLNRHYHVCKTTDIELAFNKRQLINNIIHHQKTQTINPSATTKLIIQNTEPKNNSTDIITKYNLLQQPPPSKGIIYLIQPVELIGTNRYKIGFSSKCTLERCASGYKKGSRYINIQECFEPSKLEKKIKFAFKHKFRLIGGTEYFLGDERQMRKTFNELFELHDSAYDAFYNIPPTTIIEANNSVLLSNLGATSTNTNTTDVVI
jgi:hypothetical protein